MNSVDPFNYYKNNFLGMNYLMHKKTKLKISNAQKRILTSLHKSDSVTVSMPRQKGLSSALSLYVAWILLYDYERRIIVITDSDNTGSHFISKVRDILQKSSDFNNTKLVVDNRNRIDYDFCSVKSRTASIDALRGEGPDIVIVENAAYIKNLGELMTPMEMVFSARNCQVIMTSTFERNYPISDFFKEWIIEKRKKSKFLMRNLLLEKASKYNVIDHESCEVLNFL